MTMLSNFFLSSSSVRSVAYKTQKQNIVTQNRIELSHTAFRLSTAKQNRIGPRRLPVAHYLE